MRKSKNMQKKKKNEHNQSKYQLWSQVRASIEANDPTLNALLLYRQKLDLKDLCECLSLNTHITSIDLGFNALSMPDITLLAGLLKQSKFSLKALNLAACTLGTQKVYIILQCLNSYHRSGVNNTNTSSYNNNNNNNNNNII